MRLCLRVNFFPAPFFSKHHLLILRFLCTYKYGFCKRFKSGVVSNAPLEILINLQLFSCFLYPPLSRSNSPQDKLLARYVSIIMDSPSDFHWENVSSFADFELVTVGSLINLHRLCYNDILKLLSKIAPNYSASSLDSKARDLTKQYNSINNLCNRGQFCKVTAASWLTTPFKTKKPRGTSKCPCCHPTPTMPVPHQHKHRSSNPTSTLPSALTPTPTSTSPPLAVLSPPLIVRTANINIDTSINSHPHIGNSNSTSTSNSKSSSSNPTRPSDFTGGIGKDVYGAWSEIEMKQKCMQANAELVGAVVNLQAVNKKMTRDHRVDVHGCVGAIHSSVKEATVAKAR